MNNLAKEDRPFILEDLSKSSAINEIVVDSESSSEPDSFSEIEYNGSDEDLDNDEEY